MTLRTSFPVNGIHVDDHKIIHTRLNDAVSVQDCGAIGDGQADDSLAFQNAIRACLNQPDSDPATTVRKAIKPLYIPPGVYLISSELAIESVSGLLVYGCGKNSQLLFSGVLPAGLHLNGVEGCTFRDFSIGTATGASYDKGLWYEWDGVARSTTNNRFYNLDVGGKFQRGIQIGGDGGGDQEDQTYWYGCRVKGQWTAGEETWWQDGWRIGSGVFGNNLIHSIYGIVSIACRNGVHMAASQAAIYGGIIQSNEVDLFLEGVTSYFCVSGIRSEKSAAFLRTHGAVGYASSISIADCLYRVPIDGSFDPDGRWITYQYPGVLYLRNVMCHGSAGTGILPKIFASPGVKELTIIADGLTVPDCSIEQAFDLGGNSTALIRGYSTTTSGGEQSGHVSESKLIGT